MAELTPEQRAALWKAGRLDVDQHNQNQRAQEKTPVDPQVLAEQKERQDRIDQKVRDAEEYVAQRKREGTLKWSDKPGAYGDQNQIDGIYTGPRGGKYRVNSNGRKSYDVP